MTERDMKFGDAWEVIRDALERVEDEDDMLNLLSGLTTYVLEFYYKPEYHAEILTGKMGRIFTCLREDRVKYPELFSESDDDESEEIAGNA